MPIETNFTFSHYPAPGSPSQAGDPRGLLAGFVENAPQGGAKRTWTGKGFNLIWRPNHGGQSGAKDFFLELNETKETLEFTDITGKNGIANRGELQSDIFLGGIGYLQHIFDAIDGSGLHFEPGVWVNVPASTDPAQPASVARLGSIPHGTTINLQGVAFTAPAPVFATASITPFTVGSPDDGLTGLVHFPEEQLATPSTSRTGLNQVPGLTQPELTNPNLLLSNALTGQKIVSTSVLIVASDPSLLPPAGGPVPSHVSGGGGLANIPFLSGAGGQSPPRPNANVPATTATFWIETVEDHHGRHFLQIQYTQRVLLTFNGLNWPHVSVATLR